MENNPMRFIKCMVILPLCLLMGSCLDFSPEIDFGDYEYHLNEWNRQNMRGYKLTVRYYDIDDNGISDDAVITVRNGIPESSTPPGWLARGEKSTVPEFFFFIKKEEKIIVENNYSRRLTADYNSVYHYPSSIEMKSKGFIIQNSDPAPDWGWYIKLTPLVENIQEKWDKLNMLDYQLSVSYTANRGGGSKQKAIIIVKNGIPESSDPPEWLARGEKSTVPEFFSFIKEEEKRLENNIKDLFYFRVDYVPLYHYPHNISAKDYIWDISLRRQ